MTIVFSTYSGDERGFLSQLAQILGAEVQDVYRRAARPLLVCPLPDNKKYQGAIQWHLPVVTREWLLECYSRQKRVPFKKYLVGDSISPVDDVEESDEEQEPAKAIEAVEQTENDQPQNDVEIVDEGAAAPNCIFRAASLH